MLRPNLFVDTAIEAYEHGLAPLPCLQRGKPPHSALLPKTREGLPTWSSFKTVRATEQQILGWGRSDRYANPAIICGLPSQVEGGFICVLDLDDWAIYLEVAQELRHLYGPTWQVRTWRGGHIYFRTPAPVVSSKFTWGGIQHDVKGQGSYVLGWGALHPKGMFYEFDAFTPQIAGVSDLSPICTLKFHDPYRLQKDIYKACEQIAQRIAQGHHSSGVHSGRKYATLSELDMAIITSCVNARVPPGVIRSILGRLNYPTHYQQQARDEGPQVADRNFDFSYRKAARLSDSTAAQKVVETTHAIRQLIDAIPWVGRRATTPDRIGRSVTDKAVLLAHVTRCEQARRASYALDCRTGAEMAGVSASTFDRATQTLISKGWIEIATPARDGTRQATVYRLCSEAILHDKFIPHAPLPHRREWVGSVAWGIKDMKHGRQPHGSQEQVPPDIRGIVSSGIKSAPEVEPSPLPQGSTLEQMITCGLFSRGGYGQVGRPIFEFLSRCHNPTGWTQSEIVYAVGLPQSTTCKILQKMVRDGLVLKDRKHYIANPNPNFMAIGEQHGTKDIIADRHARHEAQRAEFEPHE